MEIRTVEKTKQGIQVEDKATSTMALSGADP